MKVLELRVKNFAPIMVAMKKRELYIDFRKAKNLLTLLIGGNGTGKTTIGSLLHPFAYNGNLDSRENDLILNSMSGYKYISIQYNEDTYFIEHFYKRNANDGSISLKSYFKRNEEELNANGNVTSFKELVSNYFGVDESYLKLVRLGANVTNIINMSASERKEFMNKRLEELNKYGELYKKCSEDLRVIKSLLRVNVSKKDKLNIDNYSVFKDKTINDIDEISNIRKDISDINNQISKLQGKIESIVSNLDESINTLNTYKSELNRLNIGIEAKEKYLTNIDTSISLEKITEKYTKKLKKYQEIMMQVNDLYNKRDSLKALIQSSKSLSYLNNLNDRKELLENKIEKHEKDYGKKNPLLNTSELKEALAVLQTISFNFAHLRDFDSATLKKIFNEHSGKLESYMSYLKTSIAKVYNKNNMMKAKELVDKSPVLYIISEPQCGFEYCGYRNFYKDMKSSIVVDKRNEEIDIEKLEYEIDLCDTLIKFRNMINASTILDTIPNKEASFNNIITRLINGKSFYDEKEITIYISLSEEWEAYESNKLELRDIDKELEAFNNSDNIKSSILALEATEEAIIHTDIILKKEKEEFDIIEKEYNIRLDNEKIISSLKDAKLEKANLEKDINELSNNLDMVSEDRNKVLELSNRLNHLLDRERLLTNETELNKMKLIQYEELVNDIEKINNDYEDYSVVVDSLSSKRGIPLEFMNYYLENLKVEVNDCLRIVYGDSVYISRMEVDEKSFDIIYVKDGLEVADIRNASQGESSFFNLAITFAFLLQDLKDYNILLLDEVDGVLDVDKKNLFLDILYDRLREMNCEQCFLITHSDIYNNHDVNIILTDGSDVSRFKKSTIIYE
jgi:hypothetical protein